MPLHKKAMLLDARPHRERLGLRHAEGSASSDGRGAATTLIGRTAWPIATSRARGSCLSLIPGPRLNAGRRALRAASVRRTPSDDRPPLVQLVTRVPATLRRAVKLHCVRSDAAVTDFITAALREKLERKTRARRAKR